MRVIVASKNPVKILCASIAFKKAFGDRVNVEGISVPSNVADQPMTDAETLLGAKNRAINARIEVPNADYWIGIEGGVDQNQEGEMHAFAWVYIASNNQEGKAKTASFELPKKIAELVNQGIELGIADDMVFNRSNSKQKNGAVGILTNDLIDRASYYEPAVILALIPFLNPALY
ncbi:MAG: inositol monophosphatase [Cytophagales bacterium CG12_big_fil_rev_8_21_14_0_65_40_12]|nr:MAG: inositol monophosphatase [Cytophagales bacterium CG12_big_fil_rev_8_21_14_0_65_40_12]PIW04926.1 MAG: inositol monophosphatase [Cytophagales bacterium CG17_big_fil_post_rev_8_21_14_2_50_40_13]